MDRTNAERQQRFRERQRSGEPTMSMHERNFNRDQENSVRATEFAKIAHVLLQLGGPSRAASSLEDAR